MFSDYASRRDVDIDLWNSTSLCQQECQHPVPGKRSLIFSMKSPDAVIYCAKNLLKTPQERQFLVASIVIEFIVSFSYYIIRDWYLSELNPTTLFLALFIRSQLTSTVTMVLLFLPKIYYHHKQVWLPGNTKIISRLLAVLIH